MHSPNYKAAGFTLIEAMITLAIISIGVSIATPSYLQWTARTQLQSEMTTLTKNLSLVRMAAMTRNTTITVTLAPAVTDPADGLAKITATFTPSVVPPQRMPLTVRQLTNTSSGTATVPMTLLFSSLGVQMGSPQTFTLTNRYGLTYSASITSTGSITWCPRATCP